MMKKSFLILLVGVALLGVTSFAVADTIITLPNPLCPSGATGAGCINSIPRLISQIATYISTIVGALAVIMFMWAGICFLLSGAMPSYLEKGKHALWFAIIGIGIALAGVGLVAVITAVIGVDPGSVGATDGACCFHNIANPAQWQCDMGSAGYCSSIGGAVFKGVGTVCAVNPATTCQ